MILKFFKLMYVVACALCVWTVALGVYNLNPVYAPNATALHPCMSISYFTF